MQDFFQIACTEGEKGILDGDGGPFGAVVVKDGKVIGKGNNCVISSHDSTAHAEITAIRCAEQALETYDLTGCELYSHLLSLPNVFGGNHVGKDFQSALWLYNRGSCRYRF